jgi:hypothetical protein
MLARMNPKAGGRGRDDRDTSDTRLVADVGEEGGGLFR